MYGAIQVKVQFLPFGFPFQHSFATHLLHAVTRVLYTRYKGAIRYAYFSNPFLVERLKMRSVKIFLFLVFLTAIVAGVTTYVALGREPAGTPAGKTLSPQRASDPATIDELTPDSLVSTVPLEAAQIILPDGHPDFPLDTTWVVNRDGSSPIEVPIPLAIPEGWQGRYAVRVEDNSAYFDFTAGTTEPAPIFSVSALTEQEWQTIQGEPHGEAIFTYGGIVWVYNPALENPYDGELADAFSQMVGEAYDVAYSLPAYFTPVVNPETTLPVLQSYLAALTGG